MATARAIASVSLGFGLVSIPVKVYSSSESSGSVRFNMLAPDGSRLKQQYVSARDGKVVERSEMVKGYEFEKDKFVLFTPEELKVLDESRDATIDIFSFVPESSVDPLYFDKSYLLAPDKRGGKPYALLADAMRDSGRCALARWAFKGRQSVVQVRVSEDGLVLTQLHYAKEVRTIKDLGIEPVDVSKPELQLALQLIDQIAGDGYDPNAYEDAEQKRVLAAIDAKIAGQQIVTQEEPQAAPSGQVIDLMEALRASLGGGRASASGAKSRAAATANDDADDTAQESAPTTSRKPASARRASPAAETVSAGAPAPRKAARRATESPAAAPAPAARRARTGT